MYLLFTPKTKPKGNITLSLKNNNNETIIIQEQTEVKFLGVRIDSKLKFQTQYDNVISKMRSGLRALYFVKHTLPTKTKLLIFNSLIRSHYEYCHQIWSTNLTKGQINEIIVLQKRALRVVYSQHSKSHTAKLFKISGITRFDHLFQKSTLELFYKDNIDLSPTAIKELLQSCKMIENPRPQYKHNRIIPHYYKKDNLMYRIIKTWNQLPEHMKEPTTLGKFQIKRKIKEYLMTLYETCQKTNCYSCSVTSI